MFTSEPHILCIQLRWSKIHHTSALERALEQHADHPILHPTYNPTLLFRTTNLSLDISLLLETSESSWRSHPMHRALMESPPLPLTRYITRLESIAESPDPSALLAHAYVRYLGDLSGGQIIRAKVAKAYGLDNGFGTSFYEFKPLGGTGIATIGDMKKIKEWYREGMNAAVGNDQVLKCELIRLIHFWFLIMSHVIHSCHLARSYRCVRAQQWPFCMLDSTCFSQSI